LIDEDDEESQANEDVYVLLREMLLTKPSFHSKRRPASHCVRVCVCVRACVRVCVLAVQDETLAYIIAIR